jgi:hypothetical protein
MTSLFGLFGVVAGMDVVAGGPLPIIGGGTNPAGSSESASGRWLLGAPAPDGGGGCATGGTVTSGLVFATVYFAAAS